MLNNLKRFFEDALEQSSQASEATTEHALQRAVAALCIEMSRADSQVLEAERAGIITALRECFDLPADEIDNLLNLAEADADEAVSLFEFTTLLNQHFEHAQKIRFVEQLWRVAYADGQLEKHEAHLVKNVSDLLHLRHREYISAKHKAEAEAEMQSDPTS